jgi:hypothetical protein
VKELSDAYEQWAKATGRKLPGAKGKKGSDEYRMQPARTPCSTRFAGKHSIYPESAN